MSEKTVSEPPTELGHGRIDALDGVRGLAVLMVVFLHTGGGAHSSNPVLAFIGRVNTFGWSAVTLFFVLSGFLITGILHDTRSDPHRLRNFYARRSLRIFPLYYAALLIAMLSSLVTHQFWECLRHAPVYLFYLQNVQPFDHHPAVLPSLLDVGHFWSLAVEEQFYLLWPFLVYQAKSLRGTAFLCVAAVLVSCAYKLLAPGADADSLLTNCGALALGGLIAMAYRTPQWRWCVLVAPAVFACSFALVLPYAVTQTISVSREFTYLSFLWGAMLTMALSPGITQRIFSMRWLRWFGSISYGMYVYHLLFYPLVQSAAASQHWKSRNLTLGVQFLVSFSSTVLISWISFNYFEKPISKRKRYFRAPWERRAPQPEPVVNI